MRLTSKKMRSISANDNCASGRRQSLANFQKSIIDIAKALSTVVFCCQGISLIKDGTGLLGVRARFEEEDVREE